MELLGEMEFWSGIVVPSVAAILTAGVAFYAVRAGSKQWKNANSLKMQEIISVAWKEYTDFAWQEKGDRDDNEYWSLIDVKIERILSAYDNACAAYFCRRIDKKYFRKVYIGEIKVLFTSQNRIGDILAADDEYISLKKFYDEYIKEKKHTKRSKR